MPATMVSEAGGSGTDTVLRAVSFTLGADVENLTLTGTAAINGTGNGLDNVIIGNASANTLDGGDWRGQPDRAAAATTPISSTTLGDDVSEAGGGGTDTVLARASTSRSAPISRT